MGNKFTTVPIVIIIYIYSLDKFGTTPNLKDILCFLKLRYYSTLFV